jgi:hypothetical protein
MKRVALACIALFCASSANAQEVYRNNFDAGGYFLAPGVTDSFGGLTQGALESAIVSAPVNATGWSGNYWANRTGGGGVAGNVSVLELTGLAAHTSVQLQFLLGFLESWDSTNGTVIPDLLDITINGTPLMTGLTTTNASGTIENYGLGTKLISGTEINQTAFFTDTLAGYNFVVPHTSSTLSIGFGAYGAGWQGGGDEAFGLDAFRILLVDDRGGGAVPEPATWAMLLLGFGLVGGAMRSARRGRRLSVSYA